MHDVLISSAVEPVKNGCHASSIAVAPQLLRVQLNKDDSWRRPVLRCPQPLQPCSKTCSPAEISEAGQPSSSPSVHVRAQHVGWLVRRLRAVRGRSPAGPPAPSPPSRPRTRAPPRYPPHAAPAPRPPCAAPCASTRLSCSPSLSHGPARAPRLMLGLSSTAVVWPPQRLEPGISEGLHDKDLSKASAI